MSGYVFGYWKVCHYKDAMVLEAIWILRICLMFYCFSLASFAFLPFWVSALLLLLAFLFSVFFPMYSTKISDTCLNYFHPDWEILLEEETLEALRNNVIVNEQKIFLYSLEPGKPTTKKIQGWDVFVFTRSRDETKSELVIECTSEARVVNNGIEKVILRNIKTGFESRIEIGRDKIRKKHRKKK